ncbi:MAG: LysR family transcriptional regulator, partial [Bdellovibrionales bacterium]
MEMFEIRYFLTVAELESVEKASKRLNVSGSALSKAVSRLQEELNVKLFEKDGRNIRLTAKGQVLLAKCKQIVELEKETKILIAEEQSAFEVRIAGPEVFLTKFALPLVAEIKKKYPAMWVSFLNVDEETAQAKVANDEADVCYVGEGSERHLDLTYKEIERVPFHTYASNKHPLAKQRGGAIPVEKVL